MDEFKGGTSGRIIIGLQLGIGFLFLGYGIARLLGITTYQIPGFVYVVAGMCMFIWEIAKLTSHTSS